MYGGEVKRKGGEKVVYVGGGEKKGGVRGWWGKRKEKRKKINNVIIKTKSKNQNQVPNTNYYFLNCDFSCETKTMY